MAPLSALIHLVNLFMPSIGVACIAAGLAKLLWRRDLKGVAWWRLASTSAAACALVTLAGLVAFGRDGAMGTYAAMLAASAVTLWWAGFKPQRR